MKQGTIIWLQAAAFVLGECKTVPAE